MNDNYRCDCVCVHVCVCGGGGAEKKKERNKAKLWQPSGTQTNLSSAAFNPDMVHIHDKA